MELDSLPSSFPNIKNSANKNQWFYEPERVGAFCIVFGLFLAFGEMGPGDNIGLFASKTSPTAIR